MQKNETIEKAIKSKNIQLLREYLGNICYIDANFSTGEFDSTIRYIKNSGILEEELKDKKLEGELIEYSYAAEPPVQFRLSHLSRRSETVSSFV